jgi:hypothetical protein
MTAAPAMEFRDFEATALELANILRALGNERRLMILCKLAEAGEMTVGALVGPSASASRRCRSIWRRCATTTSWPFAAKARRFGTASPIHASSN